MNQPPLNPDAVSSIADVILRHCGGYVDTTRADAERAAKAVLRSLAVAQPVVNSVEELDALPVGSVIIDKHGDLGLIDRNGTVEKCVQFAETIAMSIGYTAKHFLPARVLYRPVVES